MSTHHHQQAADAPVGTEHATLTAYIYGFVFSIYLTVTAYLIVTHHLLSKWGLVYTVSALAFMQFVVQMIFFLHLGSDTKPRWKLLVFLFMMIIVLIVVIGSLWIMQNLDYRMTPAQVNTYLKNQDGGL